MTELEILTQINNNLLSMKEILGFLVGLFIFYSFFLLFKYLLSFFSFFFKGV